MIEIRGQVIEIGWSSTTNNSSVVIATSDGKIEIDGLTHDQCRAIAPDLYSNVIVTLSKDGESTTSQPSSGSQS